MQEPAGYWKHGSWEEVSVKCVYLRIKAKNESADAVEVYEIHVRRSCEVRREASKGRQSPEEHLHLKIWAEEEESSKDTKK